jgi:DNA-binding MarR family transcriptional regulator
MAVHPNTAEVLVDEVFLFNRALRSAVSTSDTPTPLPIALTGVLAALAGESECRQSELAMKLCVSQSSLSRQIAELVDGGYIVRAPDPDDGRATRIRLSDKGSECLDITREIRVAQLSRMLGEWSEDEAVTAIESIRHLKNTFAGEAQHRHGANSHFSNTTLIAR